MGKPVPDNLGPTARGAVFIDRDGTINKEVDYLSRLDQLSLIPGAARAIQKLNENGLKVIIITNQSGVARGLFGEGFVEDAHRTLQKMLADEGAHFDAAYFCPHHPDGVIEAYKKVCDCRKPATGMVDLACREHTIQPAESYVIGDKYSEILLAHTIGGTGILVKTGHGESEIEKFSAGWGGKGPKFVADDLLKAVSWLLQNALD
ncbi:MAG: D-glycero-alpha-D-manno-heptose-1,7-bisphosphate 7-phosphatase [Nitrospinota bacterium]